MVAVPTVRSYTLVPPRAPRVPPCRSPYEHGSPPARRSRDTRPLYAFEVAIIGYRLADRSRAVQRMATRAGASRSPASSTADGMVARRLEAGTAQLSVWVNSLTVWSIICQFGRFSIFLMTVFVFLRPGGFGN